MNMANKKIILAIVGIIVVIFGALLVWQYIVLTKAHGSFANYYAFRGCVQLIYKTDTYGTCKTTSGATITIVEINGKWYLEGDGPGMW
jgi:hypothetical protein